MQPTIKELGKRTGGSIAHKVCVTNGILVCPCTSNILHFVNMKYQMLPLGLPSAINRYHGQKEHYQGPVFCHIYVCLKGIKHVGSTKKADLLEILSVFCLFKTLGLPLGQIL